MSLSADSLAALALLNAHHRVGGSYIKSFEFFVECCAAKSYAEVVSLADLQACIDESFGLAIPQGAIRSILNSCVGKGSLAYEDRSYRYIGSKSRAEFEGELATTRDELGRLVKQMRLFAKSYYGQDWSDETAEERLLGFVAGRTTSILEATFGSAPLGDVHEVTSEDEFVVGAFVEHTLEKYPPLFQDVVRLTQGYLVTNVLMFPDLEAVETSLDGVSVVFDTTFLLRALGFAQPAIRRSARETLDLVVALGGSARCFRHTAYEIRGVLEAGVHVLKSANARRWAHGEAIQFVLDEGFEAVDLEMWIHNLHRELEDIGIEIVERPDRDVATMLDEGHFEDVLADGLNYRNKDALLRDIDSIAAVHALREGKSSSDIAECRAVFVTTNTALARHAHRFMRLSEGVPSWGVSECITDYLCATLLWLKAPTQKPTLPELLVVSQSLVAVAPPDHMWRAWLEEVNKLRDAAGLTEEEHVALVHARETRRALMEISRGATGAIVEGTVRDVLDRVRAMMKSDAEKAASLERERVAKETAARQKLERELLGAQEEHAREMRRALREKEIEEKESARRDREHGRDLREERISSSVETILAVVLTVIAAGVLVLGTAALNGWISAEQVALRILLVGASSLVLFIGILVQVFGGAVVTAARWMVRPASRLMGRKASAWLDRDGS